jgi:signal transduction histidine kinase
MKRNRKKIQKIAVVAVLAVSTVLTSVFGVRFTNLVSQQNVLAAKNNLSSTGNFSKSNDFQRLMDGYLQCLKLYTQMVQMWGSDGKEEFRQLPFLRDEKGNTLTLQQVSEMGGHDYDYDTYLQNYFRHFDRYSQKEISLVNLTKSMTSLDHLVMVQDGNAYYLANDASCEKKTQKQWKTQKKLLSALPSEVCYDGEVTKLADFEQSSENKTQTVTVSLNKTLSKITLDSTFEKWMYSNYPEYFSCQKILSLLEEFGQDISEPEYESSNADVLEDYRKYAGIGYREDFYGAAANDDGYSYEVWLDGIERSYSSGTILYVDYGQAAVKVRELCEDQSMYSESTDQYVYSRSKEQYIKYMKRIVNNQLKRLNTEDTLGELEVIPCSTDTMADLAQFYISFHDGLKKFLENSPFLYDVETDRAVISSQGEEWQDLVTKLKSGDESNISHQNMLYAGYDFSGAVYTSVFHTGYYSMTGDLDHFLSSLVTDNSGNYCAVGIDLENITKTTGEYNFWEEAYQEYTHQQNQYLALGKTIKRVGMYLGISGLAMFLCILLLTLMAAPAEKKRGVSCYTFDKIWTEVILAVLFCVGVSTYHGIYGVYCSNYRHDVGLAGNLVVNSPTPLRCAYFTVLALAAVFCYLSLVRRKKQKALVSSSFLCLCFGRGKNFIGFLKRVWSRYHGMRAFWRYLMLAVVYMVLWFVLGILWLDNAWDMSGGEWWLGVFSGILLLIITGAVIIQTVRNAKAQEIIQEGARRIAGGEVTYQIPLSQKWSREQRKMAEEINRIREGLEQAVETSLQSERMKTELITNVSHDIKTPLTSVINYVDLLKRETLNNSKAEEYLAVLEKKSQRLKVLIEDLVEASKASSGAMELQITTLNFKELAGQTEGEFEDRLQKAGLTLVHTECQEEILFRGDGRRVYRVLENLYGNVEKYAMPGTRVYTSLATREDEGGRYAEFTMKNISREPLNISPQELTERFVRGEEPRTTEGSGLGLSIARSLTELMGGNFTIYLDGDLFRVTLLFPMKH